MKGGIALSQGEDTTGNHSASHVPSCPMIECIGDPRLREIIVMDLQWYVSLMLGCARKSSSTAFRAFVDRRMMTGDFPRRTRYWSTPVDSSRALAPRRRIPSEDSTASYWGCGCGWRRSQAWWASSLEEASAWSPPQHSMAAAAGNGCCLTPTSQRRCLSHWEGWVHQRGPSSTTAMMMPNRW